MLLSSHQEHKKREILHLIEDEGHQRVLLIGSAGTGKTYLGGELIRDIKKSYTFNKKFNNGLVYATAPTHKALSVLQSKIDQKVTFSTIHSALDVKPGKPDKITGIRDFTRIPRKNNLFPSAKAAIVDECSMVENKLIKYLEDTRTFHFPIIFLGDSKQLSPVGEDVSPIFTKGFPVVELTEIVRQGANNPIIELSNNLDLIYFKEPNLVNNKGYVYTHNKHQIIEDLCEVNGSDELKYLALTNDEVNAVNKIVRETKYNNPMKIEEGETIVFNAPYGEYYTNEEVKVELVEIITSFVPIPTEKTTVNKGEICGKLDYIKMKYYRVNESFNIIHEHSTYLFNIILKTIIENCKHHEWDWQAKYWFQEQFADITYNHALTVNKSQGSTYKTAILNVKNIHFAPNGDSVRRLLYTGVTRASDLVVLYNVT